MTTFHFIRHGHVDNPQGIYYGRLPGYPLTPEGCEAVEYTAKQLRDYIGDERLAAIYYSPLVRTQQTANILSTLLKVDAYPDKRLLEVASLFEGKPMADYQALQYPEVKAGYLETMEDIYHRMADFVREAALIYPNSHLIAITHGGPIRVLELGLTERPFDVAAYRQTEVPECSSDTIITVDGPDIKVLGQVLDSKV